MDDDSATSNVNPIYTAGTAVKIGFLLYHHYAIVSDRVADGRPMLISLSRRTGTVAEEPWSEVVHGRSVRPSRLRGSLDPGTVVARAREQIGTRRYSLIHGNCEHFVRECLGLPARSRQVQVATGAGVPALLLALRLARVNPAVAVAAAVISIALSTRYSAR